MTRSSKLTTMGLLALLTCCFCAVGTAQEEQGPPVDFAREIQPILAQRCFACHGPDEAESGLRLDDRDAALAETDSGERAIVPLEPDESELLARITSGDEDQRMPPEGEPLTATQIEAFRRWIEQGAEWSRHWAFEPPARPSPPAMKNQAWIRNPIDSFVLRRLEEAGLQPAQLADPVALVRRVYYDLTGLPPKPEQVDAFVADESAAAYEVLVDQLLDSPHYGEKWARYWLDLVRFAETNSFERDDPKPDAWRYRDYVIRSFNADKPYDQFIREQLAGDELIGYEDSPAGNEALIATGFYRLGLWDDEPNNKLQHRYDCLDDIVKTVSQVFLGLTVDCARCHDHKIDPILQADYYRLVAFFENTTEHQTKGENVTRPIFAGPSERREHETKLAQHNLRSEELNQELASIEQRIRTAVSLASTSEQAQEKPTNEEDGNPPGIDKLIKQHGDAIGKSLVKEFHEARKRRNEHRDQGVPTETALCISEHGARPSQSHILLRGNPNTPGAEVVPGFPSILGGEDAQLPQLAETEKTSYRRKALAEWIASRDNIMTARVMANRLWQFHFGRGIVRSPNNFGVGGTPPTHPELLDWLAGRLVDGGWKLKDMHRLIMNSATYRMASTMNDESYAADPQNDLLWRFNMRRLTAEEIRDSVLAVNGRLNDKMFGPGFYSDIPEAVLQGQSRPGYGWGESVDEERGRRSIYIHVKRSLLTPMLESFDVAEPDSTCPVRFATTQPTQALGTLNSRFFHEQAQAFARRLRAEHPDDVETQVRRALRLATARLPADEEVDRAVKLMHRLQQEDGKSASEALDLLCLVILNLNEFVYLD